MNDNYHELPDELFWPACDEDLNTFQSPGPPWTTAYTVSPLSNP